MRGVVWLWIGLAAAGCGRSCSDAKAPDAAPAAAPTQAASSPVGLTAEERDAWLTKEELDARSSITPHNARAVLDRLEREIAAEE